MSALDELADTVLALLSIGDTPGAQPAQPAVDTAAASAPGGGCLQDLVDLRPWHARGIHDGLT